MPAYSSFRALIGPSLMHSVALTLSMVRIAACLYTSLRPMLVGWGDPHI